MDLVTCTTCICLILLKLADEEQYQSGYETASLKLDSKHTVAQKSLKKQNFKPSEYVLPAADF